MTTKLNANMNKGLVVILFILLFCSQVFGLLIVNGTEEGFEAPESDLIQSQIIEGAGFFLESQADMMRFANRIELAEIQGVNYTELQQLIESAVLNMENAVNRYHSLTQTADSTPYKTTRITALAGFDYAGFRSRRNMTMNGDIVTDVQSYMGKGDIRGIYHRIHANTIEILDILGRLKAKVDAGSFPEVSDLWQAHNAYSQTLLFGQYAAQIFIDKEWKIVEK